MSVNGEDSKRFELLAHRGYAARFPENTRVAIEAAVDAGARFVEFDIQLSRDQVPHLLHDVDFQRTGNSTAQIFDLDADQVAELRVGEPERFGQVFAAVRVPRLTEVVEDLQRWPEVTAFVEIKRQSVEQFGVEAVLGAVLPVLEPVLKQCVLISFEQDVIEAARDRAGVPIGWALRSWDEVSRAAVEDLQPEYLFCNVTRLPPEPESLWKGSWIWVAYEVVDPDKARVLANRGVGMIETMAFVEMHAALGGDT
jgi:glycerophosphoryl diester phosphodiesterase